MATSKLDTEIDWSATTWEGSRRAQLRGWCALTLRERLQALEGDGRHLPTLCGHARPGQIHRPKQISGRQQRRMRSTYHSTGVQ